MNANAERLHKNVNFCKRLNNCFADQEKKITFFWNNVLYCDKMYSKSTIWYHGRTMFGRAIDYLKNSAKPFLQS